MGLKTKLAMGLVASAAGAAMMAGGTFAMFTATANSISNTFTAGTVDLTATGDSAWTGNASIGNLAPGDSGSVGTITLDNTGNLSEWVQLTSYVTGGTKDIFANLSPSESTPDNNPLSLTYSASSVSADTNRSSGLPTSITYGPSSSPVTVSSYLPSDLSSSQSVMLAGLNNNGTNVEKTSGNADVQYLFLPAHSNVVLTYNYSFPSAAGNDYQGASGTVTVKAQAVQARNNTVSNSSYTGGVGPESMS